MDEKQLKELTDGLNAKFETLGNDVEKANGSIDKFDKSVEEIRETLKSVADKEYAEKMQSQLDTVEEKINDLALKSVEGETTDQQFEKFFKSDKYQAAKKEKGHSGVFELKASTITTSNSFTQTNSPIIPYQRDPLIGVDPRNPFILTQLVSKGVINKSDYIDWFERTGETDGSGAVAEAATFAQSDVSWTSYKLPVQKIGAYAKVSREKLEDTDFVRGEIMEALGYQAPNNLEYQCWSGDGTSNAQYGLLGAAAYNAAKAFSKPTGVDTVQAANQINVLKAAILQIALGSNTTNSQTSLVAGYNANGIIVNPVDYYNMESLKDTTNQSLVGLDGLMRVGGVPVYKSTRIAAGSYLVGDFSRAKLYSRRNTEIKMWDQNASDPIYDLVTFTVSNRACFQIKHVDTYAFVTGTFAAGIAALSA